jgi:hypothetical protein
MKLKIFCRCSLGPSWSDYGLISNPVHVCMYAIVLSVEPRLNVWVQATRVRDNEMCVMFWRVNLREKHMMEDLT